MSLSMAFSSSGVVKVADRPGYELVDTDKRRLPTDLMLFQMLLI